MTPEAFASALPGRGVLCGIDLGTKTIGLAFSDAEWALAGPGPVIRRTREAADLAALRTIVGERHVLGFVIGLPLNMDGRPGPSAQRSRAFSRTLEREFALPWLMWDERLTSEEAKAEMLEADVPRAKWPERIDAFAAAIILRSALRALVAAS